jgi:hypothetical protein
MIKSWELRTVVLVDALMEYVFMKQCFAPRELVRPSPNSDHLEKA